MRALQCTLACRARGMVLLLGLLLSLFPGVTQARVIGDGGGMSAVGTDVTGAVASSSESLGDDAAVATPEFYVRAGHGSPVVRSAPSNSSPALSGVYLDTSLRVVGERVDGNGYVWYSTRLWGVLPGWIRADQTDVGPPPTATPDDSSSAQDAGSPSSAPSWPLHPLNTTGQLVDEYVLRDGPSIDANDVDTIRAGANVAVTGWAMDADGSAWFRVTVAGETGWIWAGGVNLATTDPNQFTINGHPVWSAVTGKGMWVPVPLLEMSSPDSIIAAASELGLTHLYLEVGSSDGGFYGKRELDRLLPVAHAHGIAVVGWVMTSLNDIPSDVALCAKLAAYKTPSGDRLDGIAPDIEVNMYPPDVKTFAQVLRYQVGPSELIVGVIYPAGTWIGQQHPIVSALSRSFNVLAPMDYWHDAPGDFSDTLIRSFVKESVKDIHAIAGPTYPVAVVGQAYDGFARDGTGPENPSGHEVSAALQAASSSGAIGVSLFQWGTATPSEWSALRQFHWQG